MKDKLSNILYYGLVIAGIIVGLFFAVCIIYIFINIISEEWKNTAIIFAGFFVILLMIYLIKRVRNEL